MRRRPPQGHWRTSRLEVPTMKEVDPNDTKRIIEAMKKSA
jgi:hypothetical protein